jgi:hypothetical protein
VRTLRVTGSEGSDGAPTCGAPAVGGGGESRGTIGLATGGGVGPTGGGKGERIELGAAGVVVVIWVEDTAAIGMGGVNRRAVG